MTERNGQTDLIIRSEEDLQSIFDNILEDITVLDEKRVRLSDNYPTTLVIKIEGKRFDSSLTPAIMQGIIDLQLGIYRLYAQNVYGDVRKHLSEEEKRSLELVIKVERGSTELIIDYCDAILRMGEKMSGEQILAGVAILAGVWFLNRVASLGFNTYKAITLKEKERLIQQETTTAGTETTKQALENMRKVIDITSDVQKDMYRHFTRTEFQQISMNGRSVSKMELSEEVKQTRVREQAYTSVIDDEYKVRSFYFEDDNTLVDIESISSGKWLRKVSLQDGFITEEDYSIIKNAVDRDPIKLRIVVEMKRDEIKKAALTEILQ